MQPDPPVVIAKRAEDLFPGSHRAAIAQAAKDDRGLQADAFATRGTSHLFDADPFAKRTDLRVEGASAIATRTWLAISRAGWLGFQSFKNSSRSQRRSAPGRVVKHHVLFIKADNNRIMADHRTRGSGND